MANLMRLRDIQTTHPDVLGNDYFDPTNKTAYAMNNEKLGSVEGALVDEASGRIRYFIVDVGGWFTSKDVLIPAGLARIVGDDIYFDSLTKDQVKAMEDYDPDYNYNYEEQNVRDRKVFETPAEVGATTAKPIALTEKEYSAPNTLQLLEERLTVNKDRIVAGLLQVGKHVVSENRTVNVELQEDQAHIQRTPVNKATTATIGDDSRTIEVQLETERANVGKQTFVTEEINVGKVSQTRTETINETVRREELDVNQDGVVRTDAPNAVNGKNNNLK